MKVYPVFLNDLGRRRCVIVGGGEEAERKVAGLLEVEADVTVIAAEVTPELRAWAEEGRLRWLAREYERGDLKGAWLVICEGHDARVNEWVWQEGEAEGALVNVMDDVPHCNFVAGSVVRRDPLVISISTSGAAPALSVRLRQEFEQRFGPEYAAFLELMAELREPMARRFPEFSERRERWYELVDSNVLELLAENRQQEARQRVQEIFAVA